MVEASNKYRSQKLYIYLDNDEYVLIPKKCNTLTIHVKPQLYTMRVTRYKENVMNAIGSAGDVVTRDFSSGIFGEVTTMMGTIFGIAASVGGRIGGMMHEKELLNMKKGGTKKVKITVNYIGLIKIEQE